MPDAAHPFDPAFTTWVDDPGSPSTPGASDINRLQKNELYLSSKPSAMIYRSDIQPIPSSLTFASMFWNRVAYKTDLAMVAAINPAYTDRILLNTPGEWDVGVNVRSDFTSTVANGSVQVQLQACFTSLSSIPIDDDWREAKTSQAVYLRCATTLIVTAQQITDGIGVKAQVSQNSGANMALTTDIFGAHPRLWARWVGTGQV